MSGGKFIKLSRIEDSPELEFLISGHHNEFILLTVISQRARRSFDRCKFTGAEQNQALIGDFKNYGMSERNYRTAKKNLEKWEFATFKGTSKGTIATLCNSDVYDINAEEGDGQHDGQPTDDRRTGDGRVTTKKNVKNENNANNEKNNTPSFDVEDAFKQFWAIFPKKIGKLDAKKKFAKAMKEATLSELIESLNKQKLSFEWTKEGGRYIPNPSTWLNQGRWMDEIAVATPKAKKMSEMTYQEQQEHLDKIQANIMGARK